LLITLASANASLVGHVFDENKQPLKGVRVRLSGLGWQLASMTDSSGRYTLHNLVPGESIGISAVSVDYGPVFFNDVVVSSEPFDIRFAGPSSERITGTVVDYNEDLVSWTEVEIRGDNYRGYLYTDGSGRFRATRCVPGQVYEIRKPGSGARVVNVKSGTTGIVLKTE